MPRNITLSIPDDLAAEMDQLQEVNWSSVARTAFSEYIERRKEPDISEIVDKHKKEKDKAYSLGYEHGLKILKEASFERIEYIFDRYDQEKSEYRKEQNLNTVFISKTGPIMRPIPVEASIAILFGILRKLALIPVSPNEQFKHGVWDCFIKVKSKLAKGDVA